MNIKGIRGDYHIHSEYSHGKGNIRKNIESALAKGLGEIAITDHGPRAHSIIPLGIRRPESLYEIKSKISGFQSRYPDIKILLGVEANIINRQGDLDIPDHILNELDIVAAGLHLLIIPPDFKTAHRLIFDNKVTYKLFPGYRREIRKWNTEAVVNAVHNHNIDFITHPGYQLDIDTYELASACELTGTCLEINARHGVLSKGFVRAAAETGVEFIINSDAHSPEEVGELQSGLELVKELNLAVDRIVNIY